MRPRIIIVFCFLMSAGCEPGADATPWSPEPTADGGSVDAPTGGVEDIAPGAPPEPPLPPGTCVTDGDCEALDGPWHQGC